MKFYENILGLIGRTPLVKLNRLTAGIRAQVFAKMESLNPGYSVKDRIGISMIDAAEREGLLKPGGTIVEATSGNTGIGLALAAAVKGYRCTFVMTDKASVEKVRYLKALGADVVVVPSSARPGTPDHYVSTAQRIARETPNSFYPNQYAHPANPLAHYRTTGPELWRQTEGKITHFVAGLGTTGTFVGTARGLKNFDARVRAVSVEPDSPLHGLEGMKHLATAIVPGIYDASLADERAEVATEEAQETARRLAREEGLFVGVSSGANVFAAARLARTLAPGSVVVTILCDGGERYLSDRFWEEGRG